MVLQYEIPLSVSALASQMSGKLCKLRRLIKFALNFLYLDGIASL